MPIKLANNASAHLAAPLAADGDTIVLVESEAGSFPALSAGDWFPLTLADASGHVEITKVTARAGNILTAERAQESTVARDWIAGDRAEIRVTAGVFDALRSELQASFEASLSSTQADIEAQTTTDIASAISDNDPVGTMKLWTRPTEPTGWIFCDGRTLTAATPYTALRSAYIADAFPHGQDGSGNPKIPDMRGRTAAGVDNGAGRLTGATLGAALGTETHTLTTAQLPSHSHTASTAAAGSHAHGGATDTEPDHAHTGATSTAGSHTHTVSAWNNAGGGVAVSATGAGATTQSTITSSSHAGHTHPVTVNAGGSHNHAITTDTAAAHSHSVTVDAAGSGGAHPNVQPTLVAHYIVKAT